MSRKLGSYKGKPIIEIDNITDYNAVIENCPLCGKNHRHGKPQKLEKEKLNHKSSHCSEKGSYYIAISKKTKRDSL